MRSCLKEIRVKVKPFRIKKTCEISGFVVRGLIGALVMGLLMGCGAIFKKQAPAPEQPQAATTVSESVLVSSEPTADGVVVATYHPSTTDPNTKVPDSLWKTNSAFGSLFISQKALHVGDIVTIRIVESSSASNKANTYHRERFLHKHRDAQFFGAEDEVPSELVVQSPGEFERGVWERF